MRHYTTMPCIRTLLSALFFFHGSAYAQTAAVSLKDVLNRVETEHPALQASRYDVRANEELYPQALATQRPTVNGSGTLYTGRSEANGIRAGSTTTTKQAGITIEQPLYRGGGIDAAKDRATALVNSARAGFSASEQRIFFDATTAYLNVLRDTELFALTVRNYQRLQEEMNATQARLEAGDVTATDLNQARARLSRAWAEHVAAQGDLNASRARFESSTRTNVPVSLRYPLAPMGLPATLSEALNQGRDSNPEVLRAIAVSQAAEQDTKSARAAMRPQLTLFATYDYQRDPQPGILDDAEEALLGMRASMPFYSGGGLTSRVRQSDLTARRDHIRVEDIRRIVQENIAQSWALMMAAKAEYEARQSEAAISKTASEGVSEEARLGERSVLDILDAEQEWLNAQAALVNARHDHLLSAYALSYNLGLLSPDVAR